MARTKARRYTLKISERQAGLISRAVELYARLGMSQFDVLDYFFWSKEIADLEKARQHLESLCQIHSGLPKGTSQGIYSKKVHDDYRILFDLHQVIRNRLAWDRDPKSKTFHSVNYDEPMRASQNEALASIIEDGSKKDIP